MSPRTSTRLATTGFIVIAALTSVGLAGCGDTETPRPTPTATAPANPGATSAPAVSPAPTTGRTPGTSTETAPGAAPTAPASNRNHNPSPPPSSRPPQSISPVGYADATVRAWGAGNHSIVATHTTAEVADYLWSHTSAHMDQWNRTGEEGAAGTIYVTYRNNITGRQLTLGVSDVILGQGEGHAVRSAEVK